MEIIFDKTTIFFIANTIYVISYSITNMLWLRVLAIVGALSTMPYFYFQVEPLWSALFWQSMFLLVNLVNLVILLLSMRPPTLNTLELELHKMLFGDLKPRDALNILQASETEIISEGQHLLYADQPNSDIYLVVDGKFDVLTAAGNKIAEIGKYEFTGEMSYLSKSVASANVVARREGKVLRWKAEQLNRLFEKNHLYKPYLYQLWSIDLAEKLRSMSKAADRKAMANLPEMA